MEKLFLTVGCGNYDRTFALRTGDVQAEGIRINYIPLEAEEIFWRMGHHQEFDVSEMSLSNHVTMISRGNSPFVAIPVFPSRYFRHSCVFINTDSGIKKPADMAAWMQQQKAAATHTLMDSDGKVGKAYGARTTPHMYIVDAKGKLIGIVTDDQTRQYVGIDGDHLCFRASLTMACSSGGQFCGVSGEVEAGISESVSNLH